MAASRLPHCHMNPCIQNTCRIVMDGESLRVGVQVFGAGKDVNYRLQYYAIASIKANARLKRMLDVLPNLNDILGQTWE